MKSAPMVPLPAYQEYPPEQMLSRSRDFLADLRRRRTVRHFSPRPVPPEVIENCLAAAATAPSGANMQPWHFVVVSDPGLKQRIRLAAEEVERAFYHGRASEEWLEALEPLNVDEHKPYLETASCLIVIFEVRYGVNPDGSRIRHYYTRESVGIATGMLIAAVHNAGLVSLTHTPSPMDFLNEILNRPTNEKPFLLLVVGYPAEDAQVPEISKKSLDEIATFY
ncbi:MAG: nitroreductase family protein [Anaerolineales bacterium]|nr:MAG: nitroreductase family protein [Anaerolineales bacterium]